ncbi:Conserved_hypothetical protein [Hexamita inflata]|uniref:Uncharacterized protein n=1 Tax=Hexamita inflata TaxID=28002 RepID=A0AA86P1I0_9EUKA|nr:Conserved hypothetical protein [Hexamita inflata]
MTIQVSERMKSALDDIQSMFFTFYQPPLGNLESIQQMLINMTSIMKQQIPQNCKQMTFLAATVKLLNTFQQYFAPALDKLPKFQVVVSKQQMTGTRSYDQLWFLFNQLTNLSDKSLVVASETLQKQFLIIYTQCTKMNFQSIQMFLEFQNFFSTTLNGNLPSIPVFSESFLKKHFIDQPAQKQRITNVLNSSGMSRPQSSKMLQMSQLKVQKFQRLYSARAYETPDNTNFFSYLESKFDQCFQDTFDQVVQQYISSDYFYQMNQREYIHQNHLSFPDSLFISCYCSFDVNSLLNKHFKIDATQQENQVGFLALDSVVLNMLQECYYYTGQCNVEAAMQFMRTHLDVEMNNSQSQVELLKQSNLMVTDPVEEEQPKKMEVIQKALEVDKIRAMLKKILKAEDKELEGNTLKYITDEMQKSKDLELQLQQITKTSAEQLILQDVGLNRVQTQYKMETLLSEIQNKVVNNYRANSDYRILRTGIDLQELKQVFIKVSENKEKLIKEAVNTDINTKQIQVKSKAEALHSILSTSSVLFSRQFQQQRTFDLQEQIKLFDKLSNDLTLSMFGLNQYETIKIIEKIYNQVSNELTDFMNLSKQMYCSQFLYFQGSFKNFNAFKQNLKLRASSEKQGTLAQLVYDQNVSIYVCPKQIQQTLDRLVDVVLEFVLAGYQLVDGDNVRLQTTLRSMAEVDYMEHSEYPLFQQSQEQIQKMQMFISKCGISKNNIVSRKCEYRVYTEEIGARVHVEFWTDEQGISV